MTENKDFSFVTRRPKNKKKHDENAIKLHQMKREYMEQEEKGAAIAE